MIKPILSTDLFKVNETITANFYDGVICIDNYYQNYEEIHATLTNCSVPNWKMDSTSRNFIDYYDCRHLIQNSFPSKAYSDSLNTLIRLIHHFFNEQKQLSLLDSNHTFNFYQNIKKDIPNNFQHYPHKDFLYNVIIYLDKDCSGGTAIYPEISSLENKEQENLLFDVSGTPRKVIQAKPNRLVIFRGDMYHGGYIDNHNIYTGENWRINQVMFFSS